jgi:signal transduction histidine kinase
MACEHLLRGTYPLCMVAQGLMIPSLSEMRAYCTSDHPSGCPLYQQYEATQEKVPLEAAARLIAAREGESARPTIAARMSIGTDERTQRLAFLDFAQDDAGRLHELHPFAERHVAEIVDAFYEHLLKFETPRLILRDEDTVRRLKQKLRDYFLSLTSGEYGAAYFEERLRVGDIHQRINLAPQWYLGTYNLYIRLLLPRLVAEFAQEPERLAGYLTSLSKVMFLDMGLAIDAYIFGGYMNRTLGEQYHEMANRAALALGERDAQDHAKQTLVDMMVHDIRSPVSGIAMTAQAMLRDRVKLSPAQIARVQRIEQTAADVLRVTQNILEISKRDAGMLVLELENFPIEEAVRESIDKARPHLDAGHIAVALELPAAPPVVHADRALTHRVLQNLLSNAIRHGRAEGIRLRVVSEEERVVVGVTDQGPGIPSEYHHRIFERFQHFDRGTPANADTGLGLPFCKMAVEQMGGAIWVESGEGQGATFSFTLPKYAT